MTQHTRFNVFFDILNHSIKLFNVGPFKSQIRIIYLVSEVQIEDYKVSLFLLKDLLFPMICKLNRTITYYVVAWDFHVLKDL